MCKAGKLIACILLWKKKKKQQKKVLEHIGNVTAEDIQM